MHIVIDDHRDMYGNATTADETVDGAAKQQERRVPH